MRQTSPTIRFSVVRAKLERLIRAVRLSLGWTDWRVLELSGDALQMEPGSEPERLALDEIRAVQLVDRYIWSELHVTLTDGRCVVLRGVAMPHAVAEALRAVWREMQDRLAEAEVEQAALLAAATLRMQSLELAAMARSLDDLLSGERYVPASEAERLVESIGQIAYLDHSGLHRLERHLDATLYEAARRLVAFRQRSEAQRHEANVRFFEHAARRYGEFLDRVESRPLTARQRRAALTGEDATLVLAGAGSGKTSVLMARTGFILESGLARPSEILLLAYAAKARDEMASRIERRLRRKVPVATFHRLGLAIIGAVEGRRPTLSKFAEDRRRFAHAIGTFLEDAAAEPAYRQRLLHFFAHLYHQRRDPKEFADHDAYRRYIQSVELRTLKNEKVKGFGELAIANFLALNNVPYAYERPYRIDTADAQRRSYQPDFTLPRHGIHIEHVGLDRQGNTAPGVDQGEYIEALNWKRALHARHGTDLIETYAWQHAEGQLLDGLGQQLTERGVALVPADAAALLATLRNSGAISRFAELVGIFLHHHKASGLSFDDLRGRAAQLDDGGRALAFVDLYHPIAERYDRALEEAAEIDFHDMIQRATAHVRDGRWTSPYRFVLVDEFQDISQDRAALLKALQRARPDTRIFAVGDDWQSIYRFAGADLGFVSRFSEHFGVTTKVELDLTFRMPDALADLASDFVQRNPAQSRRRLLATRTSAEPTVHLHWFARNGTVPGRGHRRTGRGDGTDDELRQVLDRLAAAASSRLEVLILGRYRHQKPRDLGRPQRLHPSLSLAFSTVHAAKGLEADVVIVLDVSAGRHGFPSGVADDPVLSLVLADADPFPHAEERRLFYVALTRARQSVHLIVPRHSPSPFVEEIVDAGPAVRQYEETSQRPESDCPSPLPASPR